MKERSDLNLNVQAGYAASFAALLLLILFGVSGVEASPITISATPTTRTVVEGQSAIYTINIPQPGIPNKVTLTATNLPAGATAAFSPNTTTATSSTLTVTTKVGIQTGTHQIRVQGTNGSDVSNIITVTLIITPRPTVTLTSTPNSRSVLAGHEAVYEITLNRINYTGNVTLGTSGLPPNSYASYVYQPGIAQAIVTIHTAFAMGNSTTNFSITGTAAGATVTPVSLKLRTNSSFKWINQIGWGEGDVSFDVTTDRFGNVIICGVADSALEGFGEEKAFIAKYYSNGTLAWTRILDGISDFSTEMALSVVTDYTGNIYVGGTTTGLMTLNVPDPNPGSHHVRWWLAKLDVNGVSMWMRQDPTDEFAEIIKVALDSSNNVTLYGLRDDLFQKAVFDSSGQSLGQTSTIVYGLEDVADFVVAGDSFYTIGKHYRQTSTQVEIGQVCKYFLTGRIDWINDFNVDGSGTIATNIALDASGNIFIAGHFQADIQFVTSWVRKLSNSGNLIWQKKLLLEDGVVTSIKVLTDGNLLVAGGLEHEFSDKNQWFSKFSSFNGYQYWIRKTDNILFNRTLALHSDSAGSMFVTGFGFNMAADNAGTNDPDAEAWVIKYTPSQPNTYPSSIFTFEASANRGQTVRILGNNLATVEEVFIGGKSASFTVVSSAELRVIVPNVGPGDQTVAVRTTAEIVRGDLFLFVN